VNRSLRLISAALLSAAALFFAAPARASEDAPGFHAETWTTETGLPGDNVRAVVQTRDGYLWVATQAGLARFDGVRFTVFGRQTEPAFRSNECNVLLEGADGSLWVGTIGGGLMRYREGRFETYGRAEGLPTDVVNNLYEDRAGRLWITSYEALTVYEGGRFKTFPTADAARSVYAIPFHEDTEGRVWFFNARGFNYGNAGALLFYEGGELHAGEEAARLFPFKPYVTGDAFSAFAGRGGAVWLNDRDARTLTRLGGAGGEASSPAAYTPGEEPAHAYEDAEGNLWVVTGRQELRVVSGGAMRRVWADALPGGVVGALYADREGNVWVGSSSGLTRLRRQAFTAYTTAEGLKDETAWTVFEDASGGVWVGTNGGVHRLRDGRFDLFTRRDGFAADGALSVAEEADGRLWFASTLGLTSFKDGRAKVYERRNGLLSENVRGVLVDRAGRLWVGSLGGLQVFEGGRLAASYTTAEGLSHNNVLFVYEDREGSIWVGTPSGLNRLRGGRFEVFTTADGLGSNIIVGAREASDGSLWFATVGGGLARFSGGRFAAVTPSSGLGDDTVTVILEDGEGNFWMGSTRGVLRASLKELNAVADGAARGFTCVAYGKADGLPTNDCSGGTQPAGWRTRDGLLWFATSKGVAVVDPARLGRNRTPPPVVVERLVVDREPRTLSAEVGLQPGSRAVEFHFTALSFVDPSKVRFRYRLEGFDRDWTDAGARREAFYTNLPPGSYRFRVVAANDDGVWNEQGATVAFSLRPYFYQTFWFYLLCALALAALMWGVHLLRVRQLRREFGAVLQERNRIARELHDTLAQGFTSVSMQLEAVSAKMGNGGVEAAREHLNQARLLVRSSLAEARRSVRDLRSELLNGDGNLADALAVVARQLTSGTDVRAEVTAGGVARRLPEPIEKNLLRVGQEALTNAVRHSGAGRVRVRLDYDAERVRLRVSDDGRGFDPPTSGNGNGDGGGFGLKGMRERLAQLGGELHIDSRPGAGTEVTATVPLSDK
jgi:signal transduction histidine kinase/ligand-binding sensor domain-containing protein